MNSKRRGPDQQGRAGGVAQVQQVIQCIESGEPAQALRLCQVILRADRRNFDALQLGAIAHSQLGNLQDAIRYYHAAIKIDANYPDLYNNLGNTLKDLGRHQEALTNFSHALKLRPDHATAHLNTGAVLVKLRRYEDALESLKRASELTSGQTTGQADLQINFGNAYCGLRNYEAAIACYNRVLEVDPNFAKAYINLGNVFHELDRLPDAIVCYRRALTLQPDRINAESSLALETRAICEWDEYDAQEKALTRILGVETEQIQPLLFLYYYDDPAANLSCGKKRTRYLTGGIAVAAPAQPAAGGKIRLAYVSADFHNHPVAAVMAGIFEQHNRSKFDLHAVSLGGPSDSAMRGRLMRAFDSWHDADGKSDLDVARMMRESKIDIAIDLTAHTSGGRQEIFAHRSAPIQVSYLGYPGTQGAEFFDYIIADQFIVPPKHDKFYTEKLVRLPHSYMVGDPGWTIAEAVPTREACGLPDDGFVFASFNNCVKITPAVFDVWMQLLADHPGSVLWMSKSNSWAAENLRNEAKKRGVAPERLVIAERVDGFSDHLARHRLADLFLDTLPYNAHATALSALFAGLPVLTCAGKSFAARVAGSFLHSVGLPELVTDDLAAYGAQAAALVADPARLAGYRARLTKVRETSPLFDCDRFTRDLESAYETMARRARDGAPPEAFTITA